ncbi:MAG: prepilin-type N-terminal cleavage/methylation domain-containing protein [Thermodesulfobacteriota bacterium]|nr:prepilin-type N-terminal cleavage/methylation domain-containing protein [Thermodesulfobacteriota bacterium]
MKKRAGHTREESGFSLAELLITLAVLSVLGALAVPAIVKWIPNYKLKTAATDLYSNMQLARQMAVTLNSDCALCFDPAPPNPNAGDPVVPYYQIRTDPGPDSIWCTSDDIRAQPGPDGIYGTADDILGMLPVVLSAYRSGIGYGYGNSDRDIDGNVPPAAFDAVSFNSNVAVFNNRGLLTGPGGYVYIQNNANSPLVERSSYCVGALPSGVILLRKWFPASVQWE